MNFRSISLRELASLVNGQVHGDPNVEFSQISTSSKDKLIQAIFVAIRGTTTDSHKFVAEAFNNGACCALVEDEHALGGRPGVSVANTRYALSQMAARFYGTDAGQEQFVGITGTNGKSTINWLVFHLLNRLGIPALRIGTLGVEAFGGFIEPGSLTTPDPLTIHSTVARAREFGVKVAVLEASSHALAQDRVEHVPFGVGVYSNLTRDHLDYHGDMESYYLAKRRLFFLVAEKSGKEGVAVINSDCEYGRRLITELPSDLKLITYGQNPEATLSFGQVKCDSNGLKFSLSFSQKSYPVRAPFIGIHNGYNLVAALGVLLAFNLPIQMILEAMHTLPQVPGRLQLVGDFKPQVYVDYAHTPDALENALGAARQITHGKLWVIFGCGGDRDRGKRPQMALAARRLADRVVITSDNPRTESAQGIIDDILKSGIKADLCHVDRAQAIIETITAAHEDDVILLAGKGHEDYQVIGDKKIHFSDVEQALKALCR